MEKNTVLLDVEKYNELRDFKQNIEESKTLTVINSLYSYSSTFISTDEAVSKIGEANKKLYNENRRLQQNEITVNNIKKMSYWEFRKWRKS